MLLDPQRSGDVREKKRPGGFVTRSTRNDERNRWCTGARVAFPGGAAVAAPEVPTVDDAVVAESVDTAPVEAVVESNLDVVESEALDEAPETIATNEASVEPAAELQSDPVVGPLSEQIDTNASVSADSDVVEFKDPELKKCVAKELGKDASAALTTADLGNLVNLDCRSVAGLTDIDPLRHCREAVLFGARWCTGTWSAY